jgi:hypothetical protein
MVRRRNKGQRPTKVQASQQPNRGEPQGGKGNTKNSNPSPVAWSISTKEREGKPHKTPSLDEPSPTVTHINCWN